MKDPDPLEDQVPVVIPWLTVPLKVVVLLAQIVASNPALTNTFGLTVTVNVIGVPVQEPIVGVTETVETTWLLGSMT